MTNLLKNMAEAYSRETFTCGLCKHDFQAEVITWVDTTRTPWVRKTLLRWEFNVIRCPRCGCLHFAETPFFYEDFEEGLLVAVFPSMPEDHGTIEMKIKLKYGYYPLVEFFYDMVQIWLLAFLQDYYKMKRNLGEVARGENGQKRIRKFIRFIKEDPLMIDIREKIAETFFGAASDDDLAVLLQKTINVLENSAPHP